MAKPLFKTRHNNPYAEKMMIEYYVHILSPFDSTRAGFDNFRKIYGDDLVSKFKNSETEGDVLKFLRNSPHRVLPEVGNFEIASFGGKYFSQGTGSSFPNFDNSRRLNVSRTSEISLNHYIRRSKKNLRNAVAGDLSSCDKSKINSIAEKHWRALFDYILNEGCNFDVLAHSWHMQDHSPALAELESYGYKLKADLIDL